MISKTRSPSLLHIVGSGIAMVASTYGLARYSYGLFLPNIQQTFSLSLDWMGMIASSSYIGYLIATSIGSVISGRLGPKIPILLGGLSAVVGMILVAMASGQWTLMAGILIAGLSPGLAYPPISDVIVSTVTAEKRDQAYAIINSGTSYGIMVTTPIAFWAGDKWRLAWLFFALVALVATLWNYFVLPSGNDGRIIPRQTEMPRLALSWFVKRQSVKLMAYAFILGIITSAYWTFSVTYIGISVESVNLLGWNIEQESFSRLFWFGVGVSGLGGSIAGTLVQRFGLKMILQAGLLAIAISIIMLVQLPSNGLGLTISSLMFGSAFILTTACLGIWSIYVYHDRPSAGFGAIFLLISLGQLIGPAIFGFIAEMYNIRNIFYIAFLLAVVCSFVKPRKNIYQMSQENERETDSR